MKSIKKIKSLILITTLLGLLSCHFQEYGFGFCPGDTPQRQVYETLTTELMGEIPDAIQVYHGTSVAEYHLERDRFAGTTNQVRLPLWVNNATIFLNGWNLKYNSGDEHVAILSNSITNIRVAKTDPIEGNTIISWQSLNVLADDNYDNDFISTYNYTIIAWDTSKINLYKKDDDTVGCNLPELELGISHFFKNSNGDASALSSFPMMLYAKQFIGQKEVAILPRGFLYMWENAGIDHHLLQLAYNMTPSEIILERKSYPNDKLILALLKNNQSRIDSGFVSWESQTILKDNDNVGSYKFGEVVSGLSGKDLTTVNVPFSILPHGTSNAYAGLGINNGLDTFYVSDLPYRLVIPIISGWDLSFELGDQHVKEIGIQIIKWDYTLGENGKGTLQYIVKSTLKDDDSDPGSIRKHNIKILGILPL
ncbi:MAG: hypothetical protein WBP00_08680 [Saprospiraceae bacterium]